jgi:hypothetical protein
LFFFNYCMQANHIKRSPLRKRKIDLLKEVQFIWNFLWQDKKRWLLNTGDYLMEVVTTWEGLTMLNHVVHETSIFYMANQWYILFTKKPLRGFEVGYGVYSHIQQYFSYIATVSFIGGEKPPTWRDWQTLSHVVSSTPRHEQYSNSQL